MGSILIPVKARYQLHSLPLPSQQLSFYRFYGHAVAIKLQRYLPIICFDIPHCPVYNAHERSRLVGLLNTVVIVHAHPDASRRGQFPSSRQV